MLFRDEYPLLSPNAAIDENVGIESSLGSKIIGKWSETLQIQAATAVNQSIFIAPYNCEVVEVDISWDVASASGTVQLEHDTGTTAPGSGTALLSANSGGTANALSTAGTAYTVNKFSVAKGNFVTPDNSSFQLSKYDRLSLVFSGTQTGLVGLVVSVVLKRI